MGKGGTPPPPQYPPTPASRATTAPGAPSRRARGATGTRRAGAASTSAPAGHAACPWGPCRPGDGEVMCARPWEPPARSRATLRMLKGHVAAAGCTSTRWRPARLAEHQASKREGECSQGQTPAGGTQVQQGCLLPPRLCPLTQRCTTRRPLLDVDGVAAAPPAWCQLSAAAHRLLGLDKILPNPLGDEAVQGISVSPALPLVAIRTVAAVPPLICSAQDSSSTSKGLTIYF